MYQYVYVNSNLGVLRCIRAYCKLVSVVLTCILIKSDFVCTLLVSLVLIKIHHKEKTIIVKEDHVTVIFVVYYNYIRQYYL